MDKVKQIFAVVKKYHFWILTLVVVLLGLSIWTSATANLAKQFDTRKGELNQALDTAQTVRSQALHPNEGTIATMKTKNAAFRANVLKAWEFLYEQQIAKNPWPKALGPEFLQIIDGLNENEEIPYEYRELYGNFIKDHLPKLFEIVEARRPRDPKYRGSGGFGRGGMGPGMGMDMGMGGEGMGMMPGMGGVGGTGMGTEREEIELFGNKVDWDESDCRRLEMRFTWNTRPSSAQIWLAQEDLWVYEALLRIIKRANEGATGHHNAAVKDIHSLLIGQEAGQFLSKTSKIGGDGAAGMPGMGMPGMEGSGMMPGMEGSGMMPGGGPGMGMDMPMGGPGMGMEADGPGRGMDMPMGGPGMGMGMEGGGPGMGMGMEGGGPGMGMGMEGGMGPGMGEGGGMGMGMAASGIDSIPEAKREQVLKNGRYVNENCKRLAYGTQPPYAEFKMMPVHMRLTMDQRRIPELLIECGNSSMPVEVREVRISPEIGGQIDVGSTGMGGTGGGMMGEGGGMMGPGAMGPGAMGPGMMGGGGGMDMEGGGGMGPGMMGPGAMGPGMMGEGAMGGMGGRGDGDLSQYDVTVHISGIIYIYNPPDMTKLGTGAVAEATEAGVVPGTAAAATGTTPATGAVPATGTTPAATVPAGTTPAPVTPTPGTPVTPTPVTPAPGTPAPATPTPPAPAAGTPTTPATNP